MALFNVLFDLAARTASIESSLTKVSRGFEDLGKTAEKVGKLIGVGFGSYEIVNSFKEHITAQLELGDAMNKAAIKAGIEVSAFSELAYAAKLSDVPMEALSVGLRKMQVAVSSGAPVVKQLGINIDELKKLTPDQQFEAFAQAIAGLKDPADRTRAATEAVGRSGADLLPLFEQGAEGIEKARKAAIEMGLTLTGESAEAITKAKDAATALGASYDSLWRTLTVKLSPALEQTFDDLRRLAGGGVIADKIRDVNNELDALADRGQTSGTRVDALKAKLAALQQQMDDMGKSKTDLSGVVSGTESLEGKTKPIDAMTAAMDRLQIVTANVFVEMEDAAKFFNADSKSISEGAAGMADDLQKALDKIAKDHEWVGDLAAESGKQEMEKIAKDFEEVPKHAKVGFSAMKSVAEEAARGSERAFADFFFDPFKNGISGLASGLVDAFRHALANKAAQDVLEFFGSFGAGKERAGTGGWVGTALGFLFGGFKAGGGDVSAGTSYLVGERGPELFTPGRSGSITPNGAMGGSVSIVNNYDLRGSTPDMMAQLPEMLDRRDAALKADLIDGIRRKRYSFA